MVLQLGASVQVDSVPLVVYLMPNDNELSPVFETCEVGRCNQNEAVDRFAGTSGCVPHVGETVEGLHFAQLRGAAAQVQVEQIAAGLAKVARLANEAVENATFDNNLSPVMRWCR